MIHNSIKSCFLLLILAIVFIKDSIECLPFGGIWRQIGLDIDGASGEDNFGSSVAMSSDGRTIIVGAPSNSNINGNFAGQVSIYSINASTGNWTQIGSDINGKAADDLFGWSVCISEDGKTVAVGATSSDANGRDSGQVRVYSYDSLSNMWVQVGADINGEAAGDEFGSSIDMSADGKTIAIGASGNDKTNAGDSGHARVFTVNTTTWNWTQVGTDIDGEAGGDFSGFSLALSSDGSTIAIGALSNDNENGADAGHVRVFSNNSTSTNWTQVGYDINGKALRISSGYSVAISSDGQTIAIGAPFNNKINSNVAGYVRVYTINSTIGNWEQVGLDIDGVALNDQSGFAVALSADGKTISIGAPGNDGNGIDAGHVRIFSMNLTSGNWAQVGLDITDDALYRSGYSIALSNDGFTLAIGAPYSGNTKPGHVRVYKYELPPTKAPTKSPTKAPTKFPTRTPTKAPSKLPTKRPTKAPSKSPTKFPTRRPTNNPTKSPSKSPTNAPTTTPSKIPTTRPTSTPTKSPTNVPTKRPTKNPTKAPSQITLPVSIPTTVPIQVPSATPVSVPTNCGLFGLNFFCPRRGECGFWRRLLNLGGC